MNDQAREILDEGLEDDRKLTKAERKLIRRQEKKQQMDKAAQQRKRRRVMNWAGAVLIVTGIIGLGVFAARNGGDGGRSGGLLTEEVTAEDWVKGKREAENTLVEYADLQCPACAAFNSLVNELVREEGEKLRLVYRHYPLRQSHPNAQDAALAAEAAGGQGKFWDMVDLLYERQSDWSGIANPQAKFVEYAREIGLNEDQFKADIERKDLADKIDRHYKSGLAAGVNSTPTFFLNGEKVEGYTTWQGFKDMIKEKMKNGEN